MGTGPASTVRTADARRHRVLRRVFDLLPAVVRSPLALLLRTTDACVRNPPPADRVLAHLHNVGNRSTAFIAITLGFLGLILVFQACIQTLKVLPDLSAIGRNFIEAMVRTFGPTITGMMIATRVGAGIAAEIGSMTVTDQVEAMKVANSDPVSYIVVPRFLACVLMTPVLWVFGTLVGTLAGYLMGHYRFGIGTLTFLDITNTRPADVLIGLMKALSYGIVIPILSADAGFKARGGSEGVGWATTSAVVNSSFAVIVLDFVLSTTAFLLGY
jgi:phospholipid/cholesterol/gamma-HCH transport system permease protein